MSQYDLGIRCGILTTMKSGEVDEVKDQFIGVNGANITKVSLWSEGLEDQCSQFVDASDKLVMPGLINAHTHLAMTLFRGLEDDVPFHTWLFERILPLEVELVDEDFVEAGTELALLESIRFGVTTVSDMYFFTDKVAQSVDKSGLRAFIGQTWSQYPMPEDEKLGRDKAKLFTEFYEKYGQHPRIYPSLAPHAPYSCDDDIWKETVGLAKKYGALIHTHVSETAQEVEDSVKQYGKTPVQRLKDLGVLKHAICAHSIHLSDEDIKIYKEEGASMIYNPDSNLKLSSGVAPIPKYIKEGVPVAIGTDGCASGNNLSIIGAMNLGTKVQKLFNNDNTAMTANEAMRSATMDGAKALRLSDRIGSIEEGKFADIIVVDLSEPHMKPLHSVAGQMVYSANGLDVDTTICHGQVLMENKKMKTLNAEEIYKKVENYRGKIQESLKKLI